MPLTGFNVEQTHNSRRCFGRCHFIHIFNIEKHGVEQSAYDETFLEKRETFINLQQIQDLLKSIYEWLPKQIR